MNEIIHQYRLLRNEIDKHARRLAAVHSAHIRCKAQCTDCCINLTVWPVEYFAILDDLKTAGVSPVFDAQASCGLLKDGLCQIYPFRPVICRTHGLPLVYLDDERDEPAYGVMFCQKNFQAAGALAFGPDNTLNMDAVNDTLARLHTDYRAAGGQRGGDENGRIALSRLIDDL